jgi:phage terminase large subunit-like protein
MAFDERRAQRVLRFIEGLKHTKGEFHGKPFHLLPWQEKIVRDVFGTVRDDQPDIRQYTSAYIEIPKKNGKELNLNTPIPTPDGFSTMGDIHVGDAVFDENGRVCHVVAKSEIDYSEQGYRIVFRDGEVIEAGENHQWYGEWRSNNKLISGVVTTEWLYKRSCAESRVKDRKIDFRIPINGALETPTAELPIEPYLMGYWLGNGCATEARITIQTCDLDGVLARVNSHHKVTREWDNIGDSRHAYIPDLNKVLVPSFHDKVIPPEYLRSSREQRLSLLHGLMDSDGCISDRKGQAIYCSTERSLAESVSELLWTLGIKNAITFAKCTQRKDWNQPSVECGRVLTGEMMYTVKFTAFDDVRVAGLERKQNRAIPRNPKTRSHYRYIDRIDPIQNTGMQCIQVDSASHQYLVGRSCLPTHNSEIGAALALNMLCNDDEWKAEVYSCASDRQQAAIVFDVAADMVAQSPALSKRIKVIPSTKRMVYAPTGSIYQVLSSEVATKHGLNVSGCIFDELHTQPTRKLYDVMTQGSGDARKQPLWFFLTTAGTDRNSICWEVHQKALDLIEGRKRDPRFYPVVYGLPDEEDWQDEANWYKANPSLGHTIDIEKVRDAYRKALESPADENTFRQLRLNQWVKQSVRWMPMERWDECGAAFDPSILDGRPCYAGLDLASTSDLTTIVLVFPPIDEDEPYYVLPFFWLPDETLDLRVRRDHVMYDVWEKQGFIMTTEGNVVHYAAIQKFINDLGERYNIREIAFDRWGATMMVQALEDDGFTMIPFGQGFRDMSPPTKELMRLVLERKIAHGGHPVLRWNMDNAFVRTDPAGNQKIDKEKSTEKVDGAVALVMALDRAIKSQGGGSSVYDERGLLFI